MQFQLVRFPETRLEMVKQIVLLKYIAQVFTYAFSSQYFRENRKHGNRFVVVLIISTATSFEDRSDFCKSCYYGNTVMIRCNQIAMF